MHRVAKSNDARHSIVYKMRTHPTLTAPRYQEDYEIAYLQHKSVALHKQKKVFLTASVTSFVVASFLAFWFRNK
jgi:hypothetical protein